MFREKSIEYLGFIIRLGKMQPGKKKINAIENYPPITSKKEIRKFMRLVNFFQRFIPSFALIACSITKLLKNDTRSNHI